MSPDFTSGSFDGGFGWVKTMTSKAVWHNAVAIQNARATTTHSKNHNDSLKIELSNDDGSTWHEVQDATTFTFPKTATTDKLKWRLAGTQGVIVTKLTIEVNLTT